MKKIMGRVKNVYYLSTANSFSDECNRCVWKRLSGINCEHSPHARPREMSVDPTNLVLVNLKSLAFVPGYQ